MKNYNLSEALKSESSVDKYLRVVAGQYATRLEWVSQELVITLISGIKGALGYLLRKTIYPWVFELFDRSSVVGANVTLRCPKQIRLGKSVIIDDYVQLIGNSDQRESIVIGERSFLRSFAMLNAGPPSGFIRIGSNSTVGQSTIIYGHGGVTIGDNVMIAGQCFIVASSHNFDAAHQLMNEQGYSARGIVIADNVWIAAGAKILDGVTIGEGSVVAANAVVNKDVEPGTVVGGVPAKVISKVVASA